MLPKYDLILRKNGEIKIKQIMAIDIEDAIAKGKLESSTGCQQLTIGTPSQCVIFRSLAGKPMMQRAT